jgi:hypothetical protein
MTPKEFAALKWLSLEAKARGLSEEAQRIVRSQWLRRWQSDDPETITLVEVGWERFLQQVHDRILREHGDEVGRCPKCRKLTATRQAQQCFVCGHDWHGSC